MSITAIAPTTNTTVTQPPGATTHGFNDLNSQDFMSLMIEQLRQQDPFKPADNQQLLDQMSSIRQMQESTTLNTTLQSLAVEQRFGGAAGMIGRYVQGTATDPAGNSANVQGLVIGVSFQSDGSAVLQLSDGNSLPASSVDNVTNLQNLPPALQAQIQAQASQGSTTTSTDPASRAISSVLQKASQTKAAQKFDAKLSHIGDVMQEFLSPGVSVG